MELRIRAKTNIVPNVERAYFNKGGTMIRVYRYGALWPKTELSEEFCTTNSGIPELAVDSNEQFAVDIEETDNEYVVKAEIPGLKKDDISVEFKEGRLIISGEKKIETTENRKNFHRLERYEGYFKRSFHLPDTDVTTKKIIGSYKDGILELSIPKMAEKGKTVIEIK